MGTEQWKKWPETTLDRSGDPMRFDINLTAFTIADPPDWFVCQFYPTDKFPRQNAHHGLYSLTARFHRDHNDAIAALMPDPKHRQLYLIPPGIKPQLKQLLRERHGISRVSLFPDVAGAAETARTVFA
jgi:hypothetical protein